MTRPATQGVARVLVMAGGTGGHVFPALAVAEHLRAEGMQVSWLGTRQGLEAGVIPDAGLPIDFIDIGGLRGKGVATLALAPLRLVRALWQALAVCRRRRPQVVLGMGGYVTGPGGLAAWLLRIPLVIHEQNSIAGLTNRWLSRIADRVLEAFPGTFAPAQKLRHTGNPVRAVIAALPAPAERFAAREGALRVLVVGGSLGARALNELLPSALQTLDAAVRPEVWHQTGKAHLEHARECYARAGVEARIEPFISDMAQALGWADLMVCRAGALTIAELTAAGLGAVLVPFPHAVDDHQTRNAQFLSAAGAALTVQQRDLSVERLGAMLAGFVSAGRERLLVMAEAARALAMPDATANVAAHCLEAARG